MRLPYALCKRYMPASCICTFCRICSNLPLDAISNIKAITSKSRVAIPDALTAVSTIRSSSAVKQCDGLIDRLIVCFLILTVAVLNWKTL